MQQQYIVEVRAENGRLDFSAEQERRREHPYLFSKETFTIDELCRYASFGQGRDASIGPHDLPAFMGSIGVSYRLKTW